MTERRILPLSLSHIGNVVWLNYCAATTPELRQWYDDSNDFIWSLQENIEDIDNADINKYNKDTSGTNKSSIRISGDTEEVNEPFSRIEVCGPVGDSGDAQADNDGKQASLFTE